MDSALQQILRRTNIEGHVVLYDETRLWDPAERNLIFQLGILRRVEDAEYVTCDACGDPHDAEVILDLGSEPRIYCGAVGLMTIRRERLQRWEVDFANLSRLLAIGLHLTGDILDVAPGRIWLLGRRQVTDRTAEFFLVKGIAWPDSVDILRTASRLQGSPAPIILIPDRLPEQPEWRESGRTVFCLAEWARLEDGQLVVDFDAFADLYRQTADAFHQPLEPTPAAARDALIKQFRKDHEDCSVAQLCFWAQVDRADLSRWKNGNPLIPDGGDRATRIERLLQRGYKTRT